MLLNKEVSNYIKWKIKWNSYSDKELVQYILELIYLEDYIKNWFKWPCFKWFTLDYLINEYFTEYIDLISEIKWWYAWIKTKQLYRKKENINCKWIDFSNSWQLEDLESIWIELGWIK